MVAPHLQTGSYLSVSKYFLKCYCTSWERINTLTWDVIPSGVPLALHLRIAEDTCSVTSPVCRHGAFMNGTWRRGSLSVSASLLDYASSRWTRPCTAQRTSSITSYTCPHAAHSLAHTSDVPNHLCMPCRATGRHDHIAGCPRGMYKLIFQTAPVMPRFRPAVQTGWPEAIRRA